MSGLARYFHHLGCVVCGYDKTSTDLTNDLHNEGIQVIFDDRIDWIPYSFQTPDASTLIIYTPAIPKDSAILNFFKDNGFGLYKRSQVLGIISQGMFTVAVAGTHGKTTTSTMVAHILKDSGNDCSAFLGGLSSNYNSNVLYGKNNVVVVEADEYDRSFLTLHPDVAIITSMDADHLDIYGDHSHLTESFKLFASQIKPGGTLIHKKGLPLDVGFTYAVEGEADATASNIKIENGDFYFDFKNSNTSIPDIRMGIAGTHNVENAVAAIEACLILKIDADAIKSALASFRGVHRRFEYIIKNENQIFIDDYAHHPEELKAAIKSVKKLYPNKKLIACLELHTYSSLNAEFLTEYQGALDAADVAVVFYSPDAVAIKKLEEVTKEQIEQAFNRENLIVYTNPEEFKSFLLVQDFTDSVLLLMSSGNYGGLNFDEVQGIIE